MKFTSDYKGDLISRKRLMFELGESNMPKKYREFCLRVLSSENLSPTVELKVKEPCEWCETINKTMPTTPKKEWMTGSGTTAIYAIVCGDCEGEVEEHFSYCPYCGQKLDWSEE